jgi:uncharacterized phosphosugar-binding protein
LGRTDKGRRCTLENVSGLAERILRNFALRPTDSALVISSSGCNVVPIEIASGFQQRGLKVVAIISRRHSEASPSRHPEGKKLQDFADVVLDTGAPPGDAMVSIPGLDTPVSPGSTVGGCLLVNAIKAEVAARLTAAGLPPLVLSGAAVVGARRATQILRPRTTTTRIESHVFTPKPEPEPAQLNMKERPLRTTVIGSYPFPVA